jgi:hypothetical protein
MTISDTDRAIQHEPSRDWPDSIRVELVWTVDGVARMSAIRISPDEFFGFGAYGAPIEGAALVSRIENLRRAGPPKSTLPVRPSQEKRAKNVKKR